MTTKQDNRIRELINETEEIEKRLHKIKLDLFRNIDRMSDIINLYMPTKESSYKTELEVCRELNQALREDNIRLRDELAAKDATE